MSNTLQQFTLEVRKCLEKAGKMYGLEEEMARVDIRIDIRGHRVAGQAGRKHGQFFLRFHPDAIAKYYEDMVENTIPHEIAHLVCFMRPDLGKNHDSGWKRVCRALGGDDSRCHSMEFGEKPKRKECWYRTTTGDLVDIGPIRHAKLQKNPYLTYRARGKGRIEASGFIGNTKAAASQPEMAVAAHAKAPSKPAQKPVQRTQTGSKAEQARSYIRGLIENGATQDALLAQASTHAKHLHMELGFGTYSAARSCFVANTKKLFN